MLIRSAGMHDGTVADVCIDGASVTAIGMHLQARPGEALLEARGGALLPGLHDHHVHMMALATSLQSLRCGPPEVSTAAELERRLRQRDALPIEGDDEWIRGIGYHESVAGDIDRAWLDRVVPSRCVRIQHRSGRLWILNSRGLERLAPSAADSRVTRMRSPAGLAQGRVLDADSWLRARLGGRPPSLHRVSALLSSHGVTGVTDASAANTRREQQYFLEVTARGELVQQVIVMGDASLNAAIDTGLVRCGPTKIYLRESALPETEELRAWILRSHAARRPVAVHCVTDAELVFAVAAIAEVGSRPGDRIEHASVAPPELVSLLAEQRLTVVTQPNFVRERGDTYLAEVPAGDRPWLYRGRGFLDAGIRLAAGTDAPLGDPNPWLAMQAAIDRRTTGGRTLGEAESLSPEEALALFSGEPLAPGGGLNRITIGSPADLCLLDRPWSDARRNLAATRVSATVQRGRLVWQRAR